MTDLNANKPPPLEDSSAEKCPQQVPLLRLRQLLFQLLVAFVVFVTSVVLCAIGGGLLGKISAVEFPHYYPSVFPYAATHPFFDSTDVGIGTGVSQGAAAGLLVGAVIVVALAIANRRRDSRREIAS